MNHISNRNYGCRMKEVIVKGHRALIMENERLYMLVLVDKGADIVEFNYKKTDTEFMWRSPAGLDTLAYNKLTNPNYVGGWFEVFPNAGECCIYKDMEIPQYGDVYKMPWEYSVIEDEPDKIKVKFFVKSYVLPFYLEKTLTLKSNESILYVDEMVMNICNEDMDFTWGHHPNIGAPFLNENCIIELPPCDLSYFKKDEQSGKMEVNAGKWPYATYEGGVVDMRKVPATQSGQYGPSFALLNNIEGNRAVVNDPVKGLGFALSWDSTVFKNIALWRAFTSEHWRAVFGHIYILCFLIKSSHHGSLAEAVKCNEQLSLKSGENLSTWLTVEVLNEYR